MIEEKYSVFTTGFQIVFHISARTILRVVEQIVGEC